MTILGVNLHQMNGTVSQLQVYRRDEMLLQKT